MANSPKKKQSPEERTAEIRQLQAYMLSECYPPGMDRKRVALKLMKLRNTREKKKKDESSERDL